MNAFAWFASSYGAGLVGRRCARRGRVPTASSAGDGAPRLFRCEGDLRCSAGGSMTVVMPASCWATWSKVGLRRGDLQNATLETRHVGAWSRSTDAMPTLV